MRSAVIGAAAVIAGRPPKSEYSGLLELSGRRTCHAL